MSHSQLLLEDRLAEAMADLFGVKLVVATIARVSRSCADRFQGFADALCALVKAAAVEHLDETGLRIGGKTQWLHIACTLWLVFYRVSPQRGSLLEGVVGTIVHDHRKPHYIHHDRRAACPVQLPPSTRTHGPGRDREGGLGAPDATAVAPGLSCHPDDEALQQGVQAFKDFIVTGQESPDQRYEQMRLKAESQQIDLIAAT